MTKDLDRQRLQDLEVNIRETLRLIKQYEDKRRLSDDPKEQKNYERQIADLRQLLEKHQAEQAKLEEVAETTPVIWPVNIPKERYYSLPGRERELEALLRVLQDPHGVPAIVIDGLGGLGKTAMAVELTRRALQRGLFKGLVGDSAKQDLFTGGDIIQVREATLDFDQLLDTIARQLGRWEIPTMPADQKRATLTHLLRQQKYLVLVDNLETIQNANSLVAHLRSLLDGSRAIITTRQKVQHDFACSLSLYGLELEDALFFLRTDAGQRQIEQILTAPEDKLIEIHKVTGGAPLAMKLVVAQARFLDLDLILRQLGQAGGNLYPYIFRQSWGQLSDVSRRVLIYIGRTVVTTVSWEELAAVEIAEEEETLLTAIEELITYSLLEVSSVTAQTRYGIHQLTRQFVNSDLPQMWQEQGVL